MKLTLRPTVVGFRLRCAWRLYFQQSPLGLALPRRNNSELVVCVCQSHIIEGYSGKLRNPYVCVQQENDRGKKRRQHML